MWKVLRGSGAALAAAALVAAAWPASAAAYDSSSCTSPTALVADGYAGTTYVRLRVERDTIGLGGSPQQTLVCVRASDPARGTIGGAFVISDPFVSFSQPTLDTNAAACAGVSGNTVPGPHPLVSGHVGNEIDPYPPYTPFLVDSYGVPGEAGVCFRVGAAQYRVVQQVAATAPNAQFFADPPSAVNPPPPPPPAGLPSSRCQTAAGGTLTRLFDLTVAGGSRLRAYQWTAPAGDRVDVCVRVESVLSAGGVLSIPTDPGVVDRVVHVGDDTVLPARCPVSDSIIEFTSPVVFGLRASRGGSPATVCLWAGGVSKYVRVDAGAAGGAVPGWTVDP